MSLLYIYINYIHCIHIAKLDASSSRLNFLYPLCDGIVTINSLRGCRVRIENENEKFISARIVSLLAHHHTYIAFGRTQSKQGDAGGRMIHEG